MDINASDIQIGDVVLGYGARDIKVIRIAWNGDLLYVNPGDMHDMLVLPADRQIRICRA